MNTALGFFPHSGWTVAVALGGDLAAATVVDRRRLELLDGRQPGQVYHAAQGLPMKKAAALVGRAVEAAHRQAGTAVRGLVAELGRMGHEVVAAGVPEAGGPALPDLERILANHMLLHAAEGEMYQSALVEAATEEGLDVVVVPRKELAARAAMVLGRHAGDLEQALVQMRQAVGPPWQKDHRQAALAAWLALATVTAR